MSAPPDRVGKRARFGLLALFGVLLVAAWIVGGRSRPAPPAAEASACTCALERPRNGWCALHARGWVAALEIGSKALHDALDAHGHDLDRNSIQCETCRGLMDTGGFCEKDRFGWVGGKAYMSRLTYDLAQGEVIDPAPEGCVTCRRLWGGAGWCEESGTGWTGNVAFRDRAAWEAAAFEFARLEKVIATSARCETCAMVQLVDGTCPYCRITYRDGDAL